ncbi:MAG TPA: exopolysaccharide biosynthesis protein [Planctomycetota bacterium]|nr:exopolysaccharide biosynthesis protein [Planctomycetota bacterium]
MADDYPPTPHVVPAVPSTPPIVPAVPVAALEAAHNQNKLSEELRALLKEADGKSITFQRVIEVLQERAHTILVILMSLPFLFPIPTLGLSAPAGILVILVGIFLLLGLKPWLPKKLLRKEIAHHTLEAIIHKALRLLARVEWIFKPRLRVLTWPGFRNVIGAAMLIAGFILALPIPIPFANAIPALAIILLAAGLLERDGAFVLAGYVVMLGACVFLYVFSEVAVEILLRIYEWVFPATAGQ